MVALPWTIPLSGPACALAVTVSVGVPVAGAVYKPVEEIVPGVPVLLVSAQVNVGCVARALPNWSLALAVNCCVAPFFTVMLDGETTTLVSVWLTVAVTLLIVVSEPS